MKKQDRSEFEKEWQETFEGVELKPSDMLWSKIELSLAKTDGDSFRKRILVFKLLTAASVAFALSIGGWQLYNQNILFNKIEIAEFSENKLDIVKSENEIVNTKTDLNKVDIKQDIKNSSHVSQLDKTVDDSNLKGASKNISSIQKVVTNDQYSGNANVKYSKSNASDVANDNVNTFADNTSDKLINREEIHNNVNPNYLEKLGFVIDLKSPKNVDLKMVPRVAFMTFKSNENLKSLWAGIGMSTGSYNPNSSNSNSGLTNVALQDANSYGGLNSQSINLSDEESGQSYGLGVNIGKQVSKKIILQGGLNYLQQTTSSYSNVVSMQNLGYSAVSRYEDIASTNDLVLSESYQIVNTYQMVSIPIQAGYILLDKKFDILFLGGISNDLFIQKKVDAQVDGTESVSVSSSSSGYSIYSLSGLVGTEFSYEIGDQYYVSLQPQFRQSFHSFTPDGNQPSGIEVGFKFKYLLK